MLLTLEPEGTIMTQTNELPSGLSEAEKIRIRQEEQVRHDIRAQLARQDIAAGKQADTLLAKVVKAFSQPVINFVVTLAATTTVAYFVAQAQKSHEQSTTLNSDIASIRRRLA